MTASRAHDLILGETAVHYNVLSTHDSRPMGLAPFNWRNNKEGPSCTTQKAICLERGWA